MPSGFSSTPTHRSASAAPRRPKGPRSALPGAASQEILTSDYARAHATAEAIAAAAGAPVEVEPLLRERNFGVHRGSAYAALEVDIFAPDYAPPGGESVPEFETRVGERLGRGARRRGPGVRPPRRGLARARVPHACTGSPWWRAAGVDVAAAQWVNACVTEIRDRARSPMEDHAGSHARSISTVSNPSRLRA